MIYKGRSCRGFYKICRAPNPDIIKQRGLKSYITFSTASPAAGIRLTNKSVFTAFGLLWGELNHGGGGQGKRSRKLSGNFCPSQRCGVRGRRTRGVPVSPVPGALLGGAAVRRDPGGREALRAARSRSGGRWDGAQPCPAPLRPAPPAGVAFPQPAAGAGSSPPGYGPCHLGGGTRPLRAASTAPSPRPLAASFRVRLWSCFFFFPIAEPPGPATGSPAGSGGGARCPAGCTQRPGGTAGRWQRPRLRFGMRQREPPALGPRPARY